MRFHLREHRFAVLLTALLLLLGASLGMYFTAGNGPLTGFLLGLTALGAVLALMV